MLFITEQSSTVFLVLEIYIAIELLLNMSSCVNHEKIPMVKILRVMMKASDCPNIIQPLFASHIPMLQKLENNFYR